jgi:hypothetical protein
MTLRYGSPAGLPLIMDNHRGAPSQAGGGSGRLRLARSRRETPIFSRSRDVENPLLPVENLS